VCKKMKNGIRNPRNIYTSSITWKYICYECSSWLRVFFLVIDMHESYHLLVVLCMQCNWLVVFLVIDLYDSKSNLTHENEGK
jgi:hypothetical protein